ncbi:MAG: radical SAM protein [Planctomycetes bacterium]|nr:radical SAM protein [Planctomycetota bacterium]
MPRKPQFAGDGVRHATIGGHRFHLRLRDPTADNFLWIDGRSPPLVLDRVAADFVALVIDAMWQWQQGEGDQSQQVRQQVVERMYRKYGRRFALGGARVAPERIAADLDRIFGTLMRMAEGGCPVEAGLEGRPIDVARWAAPARMDLAVTYRCNLNCPHCYAGGPKETGELSLEQWRTVYERLWQAGVPQVAFTGGEPTMREDLVALVAEAEEFVTGLVTNGVRLADLAAPLRDASLDYVQVTLESSDAAVHNRMVGDDSGRAFEATVAGIRKALGLGMQVITNTTLTQAGAGGFAALVRFGAGLGLRHMSCNTIICSGRGRAARTEAGLSPGQLKDTLVQAQRAAAECGVTLQWYSPTCYLHLNPIELGFGAKGCSAAAHNMTVQPDGSVLPCQSWPRTVGNILKDPWPVIWEHPTCRKLRRHGFAEERDECRSCIHNEVCGGACPLEQEAAP